MNSQVIRLTTVFGAVLLAAAAAQAQANYNDGFEAYAVGSNVHGQGGWAQWNNALIVDNQISNLYAHTGTKSLASELHSDNVQDLDTVYATGRWNWTVWTYVPVTQTLPQWAVFLNDYDPTYTTQYFWSCQVEFDPTLNQIYANLPPKYAAVCGVSGSQNLTAPLHVGVWTEWRIDIDSTNDRAQVWYSGAPFGTLFQWSDGISGGFSVNGASLGTIDLYANDNTLAGDRMYWDDVSITSNNSSPVELGCLGQASSFCTAGTSTHGCTPVIVTAGTPSATANSGFTISLTGTEGQRSGLFFYSRTGQQSVAWGLGGTSVLCIKAPTQRTAAGDSGGTNNACDGTYATFDFNAYMAANPGAVGNPRFVGESFDGQFWYRDPPTPKTTGLSGGVHFALGI
jgi:hypothetical protein